MSRINNSFDEIFDKWKLKNLKSINQNQTLQVVSQQWINAASSAKLNYMYTWLGVPVIQFPADLILIQEIIFNMKPNKIIEVGIGRGGLSVFLASILSATGKDKTSKVICVEKQISPHTRKAIRKSRHSKHITLIQGNSVSPETIMKVKKGLKKSDKTMIILDSNHTEDHVYKELEIYSNLVSLNGHIVVMDTVIQYMDRDHFISTKWGVGNNPKTALDRFINKNGKFFEFDTFYNSKALATSCPFGIIKKIR